MPRRHGDARILHVIEPVAFPYPSEGPGIDELQARLRSELLDEAKRAVRARLASLQQEWAEDLRPEKIEAVIALEGIAAETILLEAERAAADMILVFNRRRGPLRRLLLGSVAQQVVSDARIPVMVLPIVGGNR
jgi:nucleotide-binding universal stress UspA family protein